MGVGVGGGVGVGVGLGVGLGVGGAVPYSLYGGAVAPLAFDLAPGPAPVGLSNSRGQSGP